MNWEGLLVGKSGMGRTIQAGLILERQLPPVLRGVGKKRWEVMLADQTPAPRAAHNDERIDFDLDARVETGLRLHQLAEQTIGNPESRRVASDAEGID